MSEKNIKARVVQKHDTEAKWSASNFIPMQGEIVVYDKDATNNRERIKIGDGTTSVSNLPFVDMMLPIVIEQSSIDSGNEYVMIGTTSSVTYTEVMNTLMLDFRPVAALLILGGYYYFCSVQVISTVGLVAKCFDPYILGGDLICVGSKQDDDTIMWECTLFPILASSDMPGKVMADDKTVSDTLPVRIDPDSGKLYVAPTLVDDTLAIEGQAADAKATGDAIAALDNLVGDQVVSTQISNAVSNTITELAVSGSNLTYTTKGGATGTAASVATTSTAGLMSTADKTKLNATNIAYGICPTAAATAAKEITIIGNINWSLSTGSIIVVKFTKSNTASNPTFNVNGTGAKSVWYNTSLITNINLSYAGYANRYGEYMYDGTQFVFIGWSADVNTAYTNATLGQGYGTCSTAAETTAKVVNLSSYLLNVGGVVSVKFTYAVPVGATMNINNKGAKNIYYRGAAITDGIINAGDIATFMYDGTQYHLISIDYENATTTKAGLMSAADKIKLENVDDTYATKTELDALGDLVGDTSVSAQINTALTSGAASPTFDVVTANKIVGAVYA